MNRTVAFNKGSDTPLFLPLEASDMLLITISQLQTYRILPVFINSSPLSVGIVDLFVT